MVKVSVIVPVYNVENFLKECLDSIVNQTLYDIEIICINDGSTDNSLAILESYAKSDDRIKIISQENKGLGAVRNVAFNHISGDYVFFIDSDDYIDLNTLKKLYENAISNDSDLVFFKIARFDEEGNLNYDLPGFDFENVFGEVDYNNFTFTYSDVKSYVMNASFATWIKLYKKSFLDKFDDLRFPEGLAYEDVPFHIKVMLYGSKISFVPEFLYFYRINPNSIMNTSSNGFDIFEICDLVEMFLIEKNFYDEFKEEFVFFKIAQILSKIISTESEEYFQLAKDEFSNMNVSNNSKIPDYYLKRFNLVLKSNSLIEYITGHYEISLFNLNSVISDLKNNISKSNTDISNLKNNISNLNDDISNLNDDIFNLNDDISNLQSEKDFLNEQCNVFKEELDCLSKRNVQLINKNEKLTSSNKKIKKDLKEVKKLNKSILNSNSWKLTKPLRTLKKISK